MEKRKRWACTLLLVLTLLAGCQEAPQKVQERMERYGNNQQIPVGELSHCTIAELRETNLSHLDVELDNLSLPEAVDFSGIEDVALLRLSFEETYSKNSPRIQTLFGVEGDSLESEGTSADGRSLTFQSSQDKQYLFIADNGFVSYISGLSYDYMQEAISYQGASETYDLDVEDISGKTVTLEDGEAEVMELVENARQWLNQSMPMEGLSYQISDVYIREFGTAESTQRQVSLFAEASYHGIRLNSYLSQMAEMQSDSKLNQATGSQLEIASYGVNLNYDGIGRLSFFSNGNGLLKVEEAEPFEQVVSLASAIRLVNGEVSGFREMEVTKILPLYILYPQYRTEDELYAAPGQEAECRPVYAFLIKDGEDDSDFGIIKSNCYKAVFVDMITGELTTKLE